MSASDHLSVQFAQDKTDRKYEREHSKFEMLGLDNAESYGYSDTDPGDYQYNRELTGKDKTDTKPKRDVF